MSERRNLHILLAVCLAVLICVLPRPAMPAMAAATPGNASVKAGDFTVTGGKAETDYRYADHVLHILTGTPLTISGATSADRIRVESGVSADITLAGVSIQIPDASYVPAFEIAEGSAGNVTVTLAAGSANILKGGMWCAGLQKDGAGKVGTLTIRCQSAGRAGHVCTAACGSLTATGYWGAGIGSGASQNSAAHAVKNITISGGSIRASSVTHGAGIGAGSMGSAENIVIRGGFVEAAGGPMGVGIGDAAGTHTVTVSGGRVTASGGSGFPGIGGRLATADASGNPGNAYLSADSLADTAGQSSWSGVILIGKEGRVRGRSVTLYYPAEVPAGVTLTVPEGSALTVAAGAGLTVKGKLRVDGALGGAGPVSGTDIRYRLTVKNAEASGQIDGGYVREGTKITLTPGKPSSADLLFAGWVCTPTDLKITGNQFLMPAVPVKVEPRYEKTVYQVTFDLNGGKADTAPAQQTVLPGGKAVEPDAVLTPPAGKCRLDGWYTTDGKKWDFNTEVKASMTLRARWAEHGTEVKWEMSADTHEGRYVCCGTVKTPKAAHTWDSSGKCSVCGYACTHAATQRKNRRSATCTSGGYTGDEVCKVCGAVVKAGVRTAALEHSYGDWNYDRTGHWRVCDDCGERGDYGQHTYTNWISSEGWRYEQCEKCGYQVVSSASGGAASGNGGSSRPGGSSGSAGTPGAQPGAAPGAGSAGAVGTPAVQPGVAPGSGTAGASGTPGAQPGGSPGTGTTGTAGTPAAKPGSGTGSGGTSAARPGSNGATAGIQSGSGTGADKNTAGSFWESSGGTGSGGGNRPEQQTPEEEETQETSEADESSENRVTVIVTPSEEESAEGSGPAGSPGEAGEGQAGPAAKPASGVFGRIFAGETPWWFWAAVIVGIAASVAVFVVIGIQDGTGRYDRYGYGEEEDTGDGAVPQGRDA